MLWDMAIVGGGIVGLAVARELLEQCPSLKCVVIEKENDIAQHQTGRNSGVIHSGIYYTPGSLKAKLCRRGRKSLLDYAKKHKVPHEICGKIIVATEERERPEILRLLKRAEENEIEEVRLLSSKQIEMREPYGRGIEAIEVGCSGIIDYRSVSRAFLEEFLSYSQTEALKSTQLVGFDQREDHVQLQTKEGLVQAKYALICGGLQGDRLALLDDMELDYRVVPFRGDYYKLSSQAREKVKHLIYPVPDPQFPFLGVHLTRMIQGGVECGPNAVFSLSREGYERFSINLKDTWDSLSFSGTWKLFLKHWRSGLSELHRSHSKAKFCQSLNKFIPSIKVEDLQEWSSGIRAVMVQKNGQFVDDFVFKEKGRVLHVLNTPSPAATASMAIAQEVSLKARDLFSL